VPWSLAVLMTLIPVANGPFTSTRNRNSLVNNIVPTNVGRRQTHIVILHIVTLMGSLGASRGTQGNWGLLFLGGFLRWSVRRGLLRSGVCIGLSRLPYSIASCPLEGGTFSMVWPNSGMFLVA